ncbi:MAG: hypothetical protein GY851_35725 [bacterium]|nr:hypothetical protein [bacterium]
MKTRTLAGKNYEGNPFPAYTEPYKKIRRKEGRQVSPVNLKRTGHMLNSMSHHDFANKTIIDFGPDESARAHGLTTGKYPFFAISVDDEDALGKEIIRQMRKQRAKRGGQ